MTLRFRKLHGSGNDFIVVGGSTRDVDWRAAAPRLCARHTGVGADGLVVSRPLDGPEAAAEVLCVNADGSVASMCANALRCAAWCASLDHGWTTMRLLMAGTWHDAEVDGAQARVTAQVDRVELNHVAQPWHGGTLWFDAVNTGAEHAVCLVEDVEQIDFERLNRLVQQHDGLTPPGANVSVVQPVDGQTLAVRTCERGVWTEALSCAAAAVAAVAAAARRGLVEEAKPVTVHNRSGIPLLVEAYERGASAYWVGGLVTPVFDGEVRL